MWETSEDAEEGIIVYCDADSIVCYWTCCVSLSPVLRVIYEELETNEGLVGNELSINVSGLFVVVQTPPTNWSRRWLSSSSMQRRTNQSGEKNRWRSLKRCVRLVSRWSITSSAQWSCSHADELFMRCVWLQTDLCFRIITKLWKMQMRRSSWPIRSMTWWVPHSDATVDILYWTCWTSRTHLEPVVNRLYRNIHIKTVPRFCVANRRTAGGWRRWCIQVQLLLFVGKQICSCTVVLSLQLWLFNIWIILSKIIQTIINCVFVNQALLYLWGIYCTNTKVILHMNAFELVQNMCGWSFRHDRGCQMFSFTEVE